MATQESDCGFLPRYTTQMDANRKIKTKKYPKQWVVKACRYCKEFHIKRVCHGYQSLHKKH